MGASMGLAIGLPAAQALLIFAVLGAGMALPYLLAGWLPFVARALPRPGAWMETFKHLMAFPMFATVVWLLWVLGQQSGIDGAAALLTLLVVVAMLVWALRLTGPSRRWMAGGSTVLLLSLVWAIGPTIVQPLAAPAQATAHDRWQTWEPGRVDQLLAQGKPVFVDFTAAWCVTPGQQKNCVGASGCVGRSGCQKGNPAACRLDPARSGHHRCAGATGAQWRAGLCVVPAWCGTGFAV